MEIVFSMITKDSVSKLRHSPIKLEHVLNSSLQIPYKTFILVDVSTDETAEVIRKWCNEHNKELILIKGGKTRAEARQIAINTFLEHWKRGDWLMFLDDDFVLNQGWWNEAKQYIDDPKVGLIWGLNWDSTTERRLYLKIFGIDYEQYLIKEFFKRGGTHDTMLRYEAIEGIKIPDELHWFEDGYILRYVQSKGFEVKIVKTGGIHYNPWIGYKPTWAINVNEIKQMAKIAKKYGFDKPSITRFLMVLIGGLPVNVIPSLQSFGLRGFKRGFTRWLVKTLYRWYLLHESP